MYCCFTDKFVAEMYNDKAIMEGLLLEFFAADRLEWVVLIKQSNAC